MTRGRGPKLGPRQDLAHLIIHNRGRKAIREEGLASRLDLTVEQMYRRLGRKILLFSRTSWFEVQPEKRRETKRSGQLRPTLAFTLSGVLMVGASLGMEPALAAAMEIVPLLKTRRRSSKNKQRRPRRADDPERQAKYEKVFAKLQLEWRKLLKKL